jgi:hypothetical protein
VESLNTLQRILNSIATTLDSGGPNLAVVLQGFVLFFALLALVMLAYGILYNGRVLHGAFGLLVRLALVSFALAR